MGNNWTLANLKIQFTQSIKGCPNAQASQAGAFILYEDFSHQNVYEYIGLMFMHTCLRFMFMQWINKREKRNSSLQLTLKDEGVKNEFRNIKKENLYLTNFLKKCQYITIGFRFFIKVKS